MDEMTACEICGFKCDRDEGKYESGFGFICNECDSDDE